MKFITITELEEQQDFELYEIYTDYEGKRIIHIFAYTYMGDDWRLTEGTGIIIPLDEFIANFTEQGEEYTDELWRETNQYDGAMSAAELVTTINGFFNGYPADAFLQYGDITPDTPDGNYIHQYCHN